MTESRNRKVLAGITIAIVATLYALCIGFAVSPKVTELDKFLITTHEPIDSVYFYKDDRRMETVVWSKNYVTTHYINLPIKWVRRISAGYVVKDINGYTVCQGTLVMPYSTMIFDRIQRLPFSYRTQHMTNQESNEKNPYNR